MCGVGGCEQWVCRVRCDTMQCHFSLSMFQTQVYPVGNCNPKLVELIMIGSLETLEYILYPIGADMIN